MQAGKPDHEKTVAERFVEVRVLAGLSQKQLNRLSALGPGHLSRIESGLRKRPREGTADAVAEALAAEGVHVTTRWLRFGSGPAPVKTKTKG